MTLSKSGFDLVGQSCSPIGCYVRWVTGMSRLVSPLEKKNVAVCFCVGQRGQTGMCPCGFLSDQVGCRELLLFPVVLCSVWTILSLVLFLEVMLTAKIHNFITFFLLLNKLIILKIKFKGFGPKMSKLRI